MSILKKLLSSTENNFSDKTTSEKLAIVRDDVEKRVSSKKISMKGLKR